jgi:hypothetical protein
VFGMGTGVTLLLWPPGKAMSKNNGAEPGHTPGCASRLGPVSAVTAATRGVGELNTLQRQSSDHAPAGVRHCPLQGGVSKAEALPHVLN